MNRISSYLIRLTLLLVVTLVTGCLAQPMASIPAPLLGAWHGEATVRLPIVFVPEPDDDPSDDVVAPVAIDLTIRDEGTVTGTVGDAQLVDCMLKQNRGELGRRLNLATDYIVMDGYLRGAIVPEDETPVKDLRFPSISLTAICAAHFFGCKQGSTRYHSCRGLI